jgi:hypothetical protein
VLVELAIEAVVIVNFINIDTVVMRTNSKESLIRRVLDDFGPLFGILQGFNLLIKVL